LNVIARLFSLAALIAAWYIGAAVGDPRTFPRPDAVAAAVWAETLSGALPVNLAVTLLRVAASFAIAMAIGAALGLWMGRRRLADDLIDPWLIVLLNLPALVIIVLAYLWAGLNEAAAIIAVMLNKLPNATVTVREGARSLDRQLDEMAQVFRMSPLVRLRHVVIPQLAPYLAAATRSGLSLVWKIVLVAELVGGRPNGVGAEIYTAFQNVDVTRILAYTVAFVLVMLVIEAILVQPLERFVSRWRPKAA
jgi:NitT/TauT family transport system permease protein